MNTKLLAAAAIAAMGLGATAANASTSCDTTTHVCTDGAISITITSVAQADLVGGYTEGLTPAGFTMLQDFDGPGSSNFLFSGFNVFPGGVGGAAAPPGDTSNYESVQPNNAFTMTALTGTLSAIAFYMGSPDDSPGFYNQLDLTINGGHTISLQGNQIWGGSSGGGDQSKGFLITYSFNPGTVTSLSFSQVGSPAFEFDNISGQGTATVPEPATWGLMIMGFGAAGAMLRRRKAVAA